MHVSKILNLMVLLSTGMLFAALPPMPPKPPAINKVAAIVQGLQLPPSWKPMRHGECIFKRNLKMELR